MSPVPVLIRNQEHGQGLVEFALVFPLLLVFILLAVDFGLVLDRREIVQHAVREGAREAAVGTNPAAVITETVNQSRGTLKAGNVRVCYTNDNPNNLLGGAGDSVHVSATYTHEFAIGVEMLGAWKVSAPAIEMTPSASARLEKAVFGASACS